MSARPFQKGDMIRSRRNPSNGVLRVTSVNGDLVRVRALGAFAYSASLGDLSEWEIVPKDLSLFSDDRPWSDLAPGIDQEDSNQP